MGSSGGMVEVTVVMVGKGRKRDMNGKIGRDNVKEERKKYYNK